MKARVIRNYYIQSTIGEGSSARVYQATHGLTRLPVAIKAISKDFIIADPENRARTKREVEVLKKADHPYIAKFYDFFEDSCYEYLVEELGTNGTLLDYANARVMSEDEARKFFVQLLSALEYVHDTLKIVHRDIKAENVLLDENFNARLIDFGLCNTSQNGMLLTSCGSLCYASPEIVAGRPYSTPTDVWSLGVLLFAMAVGTLPFDDVNQKRLAQKILYGQPIMPASLSDDLADLLVRMLAKEPSERATIKQIKEHPWVKDYIVDEQVMMCRNMAEQPRDGDDEDGVGVAIRQRVRLTDMICMPSGGPQFGRARLLMRSTPEMLKEGEPVPALPRKQATVDTEDTTRMKMGRFATRIVNPRVIAMSHNVGKRALGNVPRRL